MRPPVVVIVICLATCAAASRLSSQTVDACAHLDVGPVPSADERRRRCHARRGRSCSGCEAFPHAPRRSPRGDPGGTSPLETGRSGDRDHDLAGPVERRPSPSAARLSLTVARTITSSGPLGRNARGEGLRAGWTFFDGACRIGRPLGPRAGVQPRAGKPACAMASRLWQAVTPEPQYIDGLRRLVLPAACRNSSRSTSGGSSVKSSLAFDW